ncbi:MAG: tetratricopeptide repeat protein [Candidatus Obscuribacterales bacterium]|nr:tetratricopeptide repeat protein [Candidatus Obscuribacterales bacterium]
MNGKVKTSALVAVLFCCALVVETIAQAASTRVDDNAGIIEQLKKGDALLDNDRVDDAIAAFTVITRVAPENAPARRHLAVAYAQQGNIDQAVSEDKHCLAIDPKDAEAHQHLGLMYGTQGRYEKAVYEANQALNIDVRNQDAYVVLGSALTALKNYQPAIVALETAISLDPTDFQPYLALAATMGRKGDYAGSVQVYKKALSIRPNSVPAHIGLAADYAKLGKTQDEVKELKLAVKAAPTSAIAHGHLGSALWRAGDFENSLREGTIATSLRLQSGALSRILFGWGATFVFFGAILAVTFAGSRFKPQEGETLLKSFFLTFYKDKPGRFVITSRRLVFVPELISSIVHSTRVSIERDNIESIESSSTKSGASLIVHTIDGSAVVFRMPVLVFQPLLKELEREGMGSAKAEVSIN